eukprot:scaffold92962_cov78-Phaeocystis_antarctica.AAC.3
MSACACAFLEPCALVNTNLHKTPERAPVPAQRRTAGGRACPFEGVPDVSTPHTVVSRPSCGHWRSSEQFAQPCSPVSSPQSSRQAPTQLCVD